MPATISGTQSTIPAAASNTYAQTVLADNPVSYWRLNDSSGTTAADQQSRNPGTLHGGVTLGQAGPISGGGAMGFDGTSGYIDVGSSSALMPASAFSVEAWVLSTTNPYGTVMHGRPRGYSIETRSSGAVCGGTFDSSGTLYGACTDGSHDLVGDGVWHHAVTVYNGTTAGLYVDGSFVGSQTAVSPAYTAQNCGATIGAVYIDSPCNSSTPTGYYFKGSIAEVAFYGYALSANQVANHYIASGYYAPPQGGNPTVPESLGNTGNFCWKCYAKQSVHASWADPVDSATGNFSEGYTDLAVPGRGIPLLFTRSYNALAASTNSLLGYGWTYSYAMSLSQSGNTATVTGPNGSQVAFTLSGSTYSAPPRVQATLVKNQDGTFTFTQDLREAFAFNASGQLTQEKDLNGYVTTLAYNGSGQLTTVTDPAQRTLTFAYNGTHISSVTDPASRKVSFAYNDGAGNLTDVTDVNNGVTHYTYDTNHLLLTVTDPRNNVVTTNHYDTSNRVTSQTDGLQHTTTFAYTGTPLTSAGGSTTITDPKANVTVEQYVNGERVSMTRGYGTAQAATWQYRFDPASLNSSVVVDPDGHATTSVYDGHGNLVSVSDGLGRATTFGYDSLNDMTSSTDPKGVTTTRTYDTKGNLLSTSTPLVGSSPAQSQATSYTYGDTSHPGDVTGMTDPDSKSWSYTYDTYGDQSNAADPLSNKALACYDTVGRRTSSTAPKGTAAGVTCASTSPAAYTTYYQFNAFGDTTLITDPLGHTVQQTYDADRNLASLTDGDNNKTTYTYDAANQRTQTTRADTTTLATDYNSDGTVADQKDGKGTAILTYAYDSLARPTSVTDALNNTTSYTYDGAGNRLTQLDPVTGATCTAVPKVGCTTMAYDAANQLTGVTYSDGTTPNVTLSYDADGQRTGMTDGTGTSSWSFDSLHRLTQYSDGHSDQVQYGYNLRNLATSLTYPGSQVVSRGYDDAGRWTSVQDWNSNTTSFGYDANGNLTTETLPSGTAVVDTFTLDSADHLTGISDVRSGTVSLFAATYTRDNAGQVATDNSQPTTVSAYRYTSLNQLCYAGASSSTACSTPPPGSSAYAYDAADNPTQMGTTQQSFNAADELCWTATTTGTCSTPPAGATTYTYDTRGNRTQVTPAVGSATTFGYDQANRLTRYQAASTTTYAYDGTGLRMSKTTGITTTQYLWDAAGSLPLLLRDGTTGLVYGPGGMPLEQIAGTTVTWLHHDQLGSTRLLTDSSGTPSATYTYDSYGNLTASTGTGTTTLRYAGQYLDAESGLYYLRARYYDPATAQFLSWDPLAAMTLQPYAYADNNPLYETDPTGMVGEAMALCLDPTPADTITCSVGTGITVVQAGAVVIGFLGTVVGGIFGSGPDNTPPAAPAATPAAPKVLDGPCPLLGHGPDAVIPIMNLAKNEPAQLSPEEQSAIDARKAGDPSFDRAAYNRAMQKIRQAQKYAKERNARKRRSN
ncbi:MAG TPA: RHS repeat-associated core domain-containing protein [Candidatus Angelobacter sp.]|nr:RHS repeat-associated core domain-containing protein [Candidatus Angelobacter sp.]